MTTKNGLLRKQLNCLFCTEAFLVSQKNKCKESFCNFAFLVTEEISSIESRATGISGGKAKRLSLEE